MDSPIVIVDSSSPRITYNGTRWEHNIADSANTYNGTQTALRGADGTAQLLFFFQGNNVEVFGTLDRALEFKSVVNSSPYNPLDETKGAASGTRGVKLFESGVLSGTHRVVLTPTTGDMIIDYITFTPVGRTPLEGEDLIFDDHHQSLNYTGPWEKSEPGGFDQFPSLPFNRTLQTAKESGASFAFSFTGSKVSVYGAFEPNSGIPSAEFSIDGKVASTSALSDRNRTQDEWVMHQQFFEFDITEKPEEEHILSVRVTEASSSRPFHVDYVLVKGNEFSKMAEKSFKKTGSELNKAGLRAGLIVAGVVILIIGMISFTYFRKRRKAKIAAQKGTIAVKLRARGSSTQQ